MEQDKEKVVERVVGFLYNALDNFRDTINDVNNSINQLMDSLTKVTQDLQSIGVQAPTRSSAELRHSLRSARGGDSRSRLISLLSGKPVETTSSKATPQLEVAATPTVSAEPPKPMGGPPKPLSM
ncbi:MAG: hypothetical protein ACTSVE_14475, partial [Candidatus Helarchaeota archaeon]